MPSRASCGSRLRLGLFEAGKPSSRESAGRYELARLARAPRARARGGAQVAGAAQEPGRAAAQARRAAAGRGRRGGRHRPRQSGGWTLTWQGTGIDNSQFPGATSLWAGLQPGGDERGRQRPTLARRAASPRSPMRPWWCSARSPTPSSRATAPRSSSIPTSTAPFETMRKLEGAGHSGGGGDDHRAAALREPGAQRGRRLRRRVAARHRKAAAWRTCWSATREASRASISAATLPAAWPRTASMADGALYPFGYGLTYRSARAAWTQLPEDAGAALRATGAHSSRRARPRRAGRW